MVTTYRIYNLDTGALSPIFPEPYYSVAVATTELLIKASDQLLPPGTYIPVVVVEGDDVALKAMSGGGDKPRSVEDPRT